MLDPLLTLAVLGLGVCSVVILGWVTSEAVAGQPHYYSERQAIYLVIGVARWWCWRGSTTRACATTKSRSTWR